MMNEIIQFITELPTPVKIILGILVIFIVLSIIKKAAKIAIYLALFALILVIAYKILIL